MTQTGFLTPRSAETSCQPRILVVEDEGLIAMDIEMQLRALGYLPVGHATRGLQAIEMADVLRPDLVLMDIQLAGEMDGIAAAQAIRAQFDLPVVFVTAFAAEETLSRAKLSEPYGYILKPFSEREMHTVIEMALYKHMADVQLKHTVDSLRAAVTHTQAILDNMVDAVITINAQGLMESFNPAACAMFGYSADEVNGCNVSLLMPSPHRELHDSYMLNYRTTGEARIIGRPRELEAQRKDGTLFPISLSVSKLELPRRTTFIGTIVDITQRRENEDEIRRLAFYDPLAHLPNRRLLMDQLRHAMLSAGRSGQRGAVLLLDLDHFKQINDSLGHTLGDSLLLQVAQRLSFCVREGDILARPGGDEFVLVLEALAATDSEAAARAEVIASKILAVLGEPYTLNAKSYTCTPSIGLVIFPQNQGSMDELLKQADAAMYQAKAAGRNRVCFFDFALQAAAEAREALTEAIRQALVSQEFQLFYQIQVQHDGAVQGAEALVRWRHPTRGMVSPAQFIPLAEETGLILPLGQWVLETACAQLVVWANAPQTAHWTVAVNVSALQFAQSDFVDNVMLALERTRANPHLLKLELTESMVVGNIDAIISRMNALRALGVRFSLDDFGTGYSSLSYLKRLPLAQLKIDQSFVRDLLDDPNDAIIAQTIVSLGHSLGLVVIAEGVETQAHRDELARMGCDAFQGYFFGRPTPAADIRPPPG